MDDAQPSARPHWRKRQRKVLARVSSDTHGGRRRGRGGSRRFVIDYRDGLRASVLTPGDAVNEWAVAWRYSDDDPEGAGRTESTTFWTQEARPFMHFTYLNVGIEKMMHTSKPTWPVERTLLTSGTLDALLISKRDGGVKLATPWSNVVYESNWNWKQPPPPPPGRPIMSQ